MRLRTLGLVAALILLAGFAAFSVYVYLAKTYPEEYGTSMTGYAWILGPPADSLRDAARGRMDRGLEYLNDRSLPAADRLRLYREELRAAESLLVRSLRAQPAQARALAELAAVHWELDPPVAEADVQRHLEMIALASSMAPTVPRVQRQLGELLLKMGRRQEATVYLARTVELDPRTSAEVVTVLRDNFFPAEELLRVMPRHPDLLAALQAPFFEEGLEQRYLEVMDAVLDDPSMQPTRAYLTAYGNACLRAGQQKRLAIRMEAAGPFEEPALEATRWQQISRAALANGDQARALETARTARDTHPDASHLAVYHGDVAFAFKNPETALSAYRDALAMLARSKVRAEVRARVYAKIGRAEEQRGHPDRAYDGYRRALKLDPEEPWSKRRVEEIEAAAGL